MHAQADGAYLAGSGLLVMGVMGPAGPVRRDELGLSDPTSDDLHFVSSPQCIEERNVSRRDRVGCEKM